MRGLADEMEFIALDLARCRELPEEASDHAEDLAGAARIARQWAGVVQAHVAAAREDG